MKDITPDNMACAMSMACPRVYDNGSTLIIIGKILSEVDYNVIEEHLGTNELAVEIPKELLANVGK